MLLRNGTPSPASLAMDYTSAEFFCTISKTHFLIAAISNPYYLQPAAKEGRFYSA
jgi:hypothetical protein